LAYPLCAPPIVTDRVAWSVSRSVSHLVSAVSDRNVVYVDDSNGPKETPVAHSGPLQANTALCSFITIQPSSSVMNQTTSQVMKQCFSHIYKQLKRH